MILQVCPMNDAMCDVEQCIQADPTYGMQGCGALSQLSVGEDVMCCASSDQSNAFTYIEVLQWWLPYQAAPSIEAGNLLQEWLQACGLGDISQRLPMGHTHSVFLLMSVNRVCIDKAVAFFKDWRIVFLSDEDILNTGCRLGPKILAIYLHVDDSDIIGTVAWACELLAQRIRMELELIGFDVKFTP